MTPLIVGKRIVFTFLANDDGYLNQYNGPLFRAAFLKNLAVLNPALAKILHDSDERKPYFLTALQPVQKTRVRIGRRQDFRVKAGQRYTAMLSILDQKLLRSFLQGITLEATWELKIGHIPFITEKIHVINEDLSQYLQSKIPIKSAFIRIESPTYFRSSEEPNNSEYFPKPSVVLKFLLNHWNAFADKTDPMPPPNFVDWVKKNVRISSFKLRTYSSHVMKKKPITGTIGWVKYAWNPEDPLGQWVCFLLKFGELTGIGASRTGGYGQIRVDFDQATGENGSLLRNQSSRATISAK